MGKCKKCCCGSCGSGPVECFPQTNVQKVTRIAVRTTTPKPGCINEQCRDFLPDPENPGEFVNSATYSYWEYNNDNIIDVGDSDFIPPSRNIAVVTCMDARIVPKDQFGINIGEAHVIRNAGGVVNNDVLRSLAISQELLLTTEIMLIHHLDCGMTKFNSTEFDCAYQTSIGIVPEFKWDSFNLRPSTVNLLENFVRIMMCPFLRHKESVSAWVYDDCTGKLFRVDTSGTLACLQLLIQTDPHLPQQE